MELLRSCRSASTMGRAVAASASACEMKPSSTIRRRTRLRRLTARSMLTSGLDRAGVGNVPTMVAASPRSSSVAGLSK